MSEPYSPDRRTALVLTGTGADGAYHAGVLRALQEAGVKIDLVAGRGIGAIGAVLTAVDGGARLWEPTGLWRRRSVEQLYRWRWPLRVVAMLGAAVAGLLVSPLLILALAVVVYPIGLLLGMAGLDAGAALAGYYGELVAGAFAPAVLPTWLPRLVTAVVLAAMAALLVGSVAAWRRAPLRRRSRGSVVWWLAGTPLDASGAMADVTGAVWDLLRGGTTLKAPAADEVSRRFTELLAENLGQPGFRELLLTVHDLDARRDLVFGLVREPYRRALFPAPGPGGAGAMWATNTARRGEAFDLAGLARGHLLDVLSASLTVPGLTDPVLARFAPDTYWRGEVHRLMDRPGSLGRLLEEAAAAGAEQLLLVSAAPEPAGPHELARPRLDPLGRLGEQVAAAESAALRDAVRHLQHRFRGVYVIRPPHNPVAAFDVAGAYDEHSDRMQSLPELMERGYEDAHHTFIDPVVAASGEGLSATSG